MDLLTGVVAVYGAVLSTILAIVQIREKRPKLKVTFEPGYIVVPLIEQNSRSEALLKIAAVNFGIPLTLSIATFKVTTPKLDAPWITLQLNSEVNFPYEVGTRKCYRGTIPIRIFWEALRKVGLKGKVKGKAVISDQTNKSFFSKTLKMDANRDDLGLMKKPLKHLIEEEERTPGKY
jgi:hypothetical protein